MDINTYSCIFWIDKFNGDEQLTSGEVRSIIMVSWLDKVSSSTTGESIELACNIEYYLIRIQKIYWNSFNIRKYTLFLFSLMLLVILGKIECPISCNGGKDTLLPLIFWKLLLAEAQNWPTRKIVINNKYIEQLHTMVLNNKNRHNKN